MKQEMRTHPTEIALLLQRIGHFSEHWIDAVPAHEKHHGSGYPAG